MILQVVRHFHHGAVAVWKETEKEIKTRINNYSSMMRKGTRKLPSVRRVEENAKKKKREAEAEEREKEARKDRAERRRSE